MPVWIKWILDEGYSQNTNTYSIASRVRKVLTKIVMALGDKLVVVADSVPKLWLAYY